LFNQREKLANIQARKEKQKRAPVLRDNFLRKKLHCERMTRADHCNVDGCTQGVVSSLEGRVFCREHFISFCFIQIDRYSEMRKGRTVSGSDAETMRRFIGECSRQADAISHPPGDLNNLDRSRLLLIIEEIGNLGRRLRRSPRTEASIAVRLSCDKLGGAWEEVTQTVLLSQYGASIRCNHFADPSECLQIIRLDTGQKAQARVVWQPPVGSAGRRIGTEFVDFDNFWGLDWSAVRSSIEVERRDSTAN
jgi:hypothetical protein